jgi:predicted MFS family arabinose efflux permease
MQYYRGMPKEYLCVPALALVMAVRMLGLFMILPVFSVHIGDFPVDDAAWIGLALGIYGFTQALFQLPLGILSDRVGRKPVMVGGLAVFMTGSVIAALACHHIGGLILGRALQGAGAIGSTALALASDVTRDEDRSKAMGVIGLAIGFSFVLAMVLGPLLDAAAGLSGIFWATAGLALLAEVLVWAVIPSPARVERVADPLQTGLKQTLKNRHLWRLNAGIFTLHAILTAVFIAVPILLTQQIHLTGMQQTGLYSVVLILAFAGMMPLMILAEKKRKMKPIFLGAIGVLCLTQGILWLYHSQLVIVGLLLLAFFIAFSLLEAVLPSWVSKITPVRHKGAAMGCYSTAQFLGIFAGGSVGGWIYAHRGIAGVLELGGVLALIWLLQAFSAQQPATPYSTSTVIAQGEGKE